jgi:hypothetical protein
VPAFAVTLAALPQVDELSLRSVVGAREQILHGNVKIRIFGDVGQVDGTVRSQPGDQVPKGNFAQITAKLRVHYLQAPAQIGRREEMRRGVGDGAERDSGDNRNKGKSPGFHECD